VELDFPRKTAGRLFAYSPGISMNLAQLGALDKELRTLRPSF
jgi:hypothetical protein